LTVLVQSGALPLWVFESHIGERGRKSFFQPRYTSDRWLGIRRNRGGNLHLRIPVVGVQRVSREGSSQDRLFLTSFRWGVLINCRQGILGS
jgi:hypothetical protein